MDCEKLSPNALKIFEQIKTHYPPDPWGKLQWTPEGTVYDNGWHDLRKSEDRNKLIKKYEHLIGHLIVLSARNKMERKEVLNKSVFNLRASKRWIKIAELLYDLNFQIETLDLVED